MKSILSLVFLISLSTTTFSFANPSSMTSVLDFHKNNPNAAILNKVDSMINSFDLSLDISCSEIAYKIVRDNFLIFQTTEYKNCMRKAHRFILNRLNIDSSTLSTAFEFEETIKNAVKSNMTELVKSLGAHCPGGASVSFGAYSGSGSEVKSKFCQLNILEILVEEYYESTRLEELSCGASFSSCEGIKYTQEELLELVTE